MEQRALVELRGSIFQHQRPGRERCGRSVSPSARAERGARPDFRPDRREMALAAPSGPTSASTRSAQSGQRSIIASAARSRRR